MPCRCDDYEPSTYQSTPSYNQQLVHEHTLRCKSQSLAHKLGRLLEKNNIPIPASIKKSLDEARALLTTHKRDELKKDNQAIANEVGNLKSHISKIEALGGIVPDAMKKNLKDKQDQYKKATGLSDQALLGE
jgi:hypothetical protein